MMASFGKMGSTKIIRINLPECIELEWKLLKYLKTFKKCWTCLGDNDNNNNYLKPGLDDKVHVKMERLLQRETTFRHILLLLTRKGDKFHLGMADFYQNCCAACTEIFQNLFKLEEELDKVQAKIFTNFALLKRKRRKSLSPSFVIKLEPDKNSRVVESMFEQGKTGDNDFDGDNTMPEGKGNVSHVGVAVDSNRVIVIKEESTSDLEEFYAEMIQEEDAEIEPNFDSDFIPDNDDDRHPSSADDNNDDDEDTPTDPDFIFKSPRKTERTTRPSSKPYQPRVLKYPKVDPDNIVCPTCPHPTDAAVPPHKFASIRQYRYHYDQNHLGLHTRKRIPHPCPHCDHSFKRKPQLFRHIFETHPSNYNRSPFPCSACGKVLSSKYALAGHERIVCQVPADKTSYKISIYACEFQGCPAQFYTKQGLTSHTETHTGANNIACDKCGATFSRLESLHGHVKHSCQYGDRIPRRKAKNSNSQPSVSFKCPHCNRSYQMRFAYEKHLKICKVSRPATKPRGICHICGKSMFLIELKTHKRKVHDGVKNNICKYCGKGFFNIHTLKIHTANVHEPKGVPKERKYVCEVCGKAFRDTGNLSDHKKRVHLKLYRFSCHYCGMKFWHKNDIRKHFKGHENKGVAVMEFDEFIRISKLPERVTSEEGLSSPPLESSEGVGLS